MQAVPITAKRARAHHRHQLRTLTYVTLDEANGGIVRNFNHNGLAVQAVAPLRPGQLVRVRFELKYPRVAVQARGEVLWADSSGQSGIRFLDLPPRMIRQLNEWIFGDLLTCFPQHSQRSGGLFGVSSEATDGLLISSPSPRNVIQLHNQESATVLPSKTEEDSVTRAFDLDWLSRPLSGTALAVAIDTLVVFAAVLLFFLVFFSVSDELPEWPMNLALGAAIAIFVAAFYWGFFQTLAGTTLGASLARLTDSASDANRDADKSARFR